MRIALSGASGVGKTTLAKMLSTTLGIPFTGSTARSVAVKGKFCSEYINSGKQLMLFQEEVLKLKIEVESKLESFISDRALLDTVTYTIAKYPLLQDDYQEWFDGYVSRCVEHTLENYDVIFKLPEGVFPVVDDGVRTGNTGIKNKLIDLVLIGLYERYGIPVYYIPEKIILQGPDIEMGYVRRLLEKKYV